MLENKVSRERISKEYISMIKGNAPLQSLEVMHSFGLLPIVFKVYGNFES